jgi:RING finger family protein
MGQPTGTAAPARTRTQTVAAVLLRRLGLVYLPPAGPPDLAGAADPAGMPDPVVQAGVVLLETDLLDRGLLVSAALRDRLCRLDPDSLTAHGMALLADLDAALGADRPMVPMFRGFPTTVPGNTGALWVDRVLTLLFQEPEQPCVLCGRSGVVHAVSPCAHLVCRACFDGSDYTGCPICHRRIDPTDPFLTVPLRPAATVEGGAEPDHIRPLPHRARLLGPGTDAERDAREVATGLLARPAALSTQDREDLLTVLGTTDPTDLSWLPVPVPGRETRALVLAWWLARPGTGSMARHALDGQLDSATDVLRLLVACAGGDPGLVRAPRFGPVPRPLRRALLAALDRLDPGTAIEDLRRHRLLWIHAAERLHPFEAATAYPNAAVAFAALRGSELRPDRLGRLVRLAAERAGLTVRGTTIRHLGFSGRVEAALTAGDASAAVRLLRHRPGELIRRLDQLLRVPLGSPAVLASVPDAAAAVSPAVLLAALGALRGRSTSRPSRVFFPKGGHARAHVVAETRPPLPAALVAGVTGQLTAEVLARCAGLPPVRLAVVDQALETIIAPFTQRTASRTLHTLPRGSVVRVPDGHWLRLFLHWLERDRRADLDLSAAFFDPAWTHLGTCDYTSLRWGGSGRRPAAVHSGDLTNAPPPLGATEFLDLDLAALRAAGARHVVTVVFSYNNIPFDDLAEAYAGVMAREGDPAAGQIFDPGTVEQRFDLAGQARASVPFVLDLATSKLRWLDVAHGVTGTFHAVHRHHEALGTLGECLGDLYASGARVSIFELAVWQAAARAGTVDVRRADGTFDRYARRDREPIDTFATRIAAGQADACGPADAADPGTDAELAFLFRGDLPLAPDAEVYALFPAQLDPATVRLVAAEDVAAVLTPRAPAGQPAPRQVAMTG